LERVSPDNGKADFTHVYDRADPRDYFRSLAGLDYEMPQLAQPVFDQLLAALATDSDEESPLRVLDVCCSYGINAALMRCDVTLDDLFDRYTDPSLDDVSPADLARADADYYAERRHSDAVQVSGLDAAANAVSYGQRVGLLEHAWGENLEAADPSDACTADLSTIDLVTMTGGSSYVTESTFGRVAAAAGDGSPPWVAAFVLRTLPYDHIAARMSDFGMLTEQLEGVSFPQRRFASADEQQSALAAVSSRGLDAAGLEETGRYYTDLYISRPAAEAADRSSPELLDSSAWSTGA